jgi:hypothetical protein
MKKSWRCCFVIFITIIGNWNDFAVIVTPQKKSDQVIGISRNIDLTANMYLIVPNITQQLQLSNTDKFCDLQMGLPGFTTPANLWDENPILDSTN